MIDAKVLLEGPRSIDEELIGFGLQRRAQLLDQYLAQYLSTFDAGSPTSLTGRAEQKQRVADAFGRALVNLSKELLDTDREFKIRTNWNSPEEQEQVFRRTAALGKAYYLASQSRRIDVVRNCLHSFANLPMPLEEVAYEEEGSQSLDWKDTPVDQRRLWMKVGKGRPKVRLELESRCGIRVDPEEGEEQSHNNDAAVEPPTAQDTPQTPARRRFAEIRRSKLRR